MKKGEYEKVQRAVEKAVLLSKDDEMLFFILMSFGVWIAQRDLGEKRALKEIVRISNYMMTRNRKAKVFK